MPLLNPIRRIPHFAAAFTMLLAGCYTQVPLTASIPSPSTGITASVTDSGTVVMANKIGPGAESVEGVVTAADPTSWTLKLEQVGYRGGTAVHWTGETVVFPRYALTNASVKRLDVTKSWIAGGLVAASAFIISKAFGSRGTDENGGTTPTPPANRIPGGGR